MDHVEKIALIGLVVLSLAGCEGASVEGKTACREQSDCLSGYACIDDECVATSEGCDVYCANGCAAVEACGIDTGPSCADQCVVDLGTADCSRYEPLDRLPCTQIEHAVECASYCEAVCQSGAECASIDAELCALGCVDKQPLICNPKSVEPRSCEQIIVETRLYDNLGRSLVEGGAYAFGGYTSASFGLCSTSMDCEMPLGCSTETNTCAECESDSDCDPGYGAYACTAEGCARVDCNDDEDCTSGVCDAEAHECRECREDGDCATGACDVARQVCVACHTDEQCNPNLFPACDSDAMTCVECLTDDHCKIGALGGILLACDAEKHSCVECTEDKHCTDPDQPACDPETNFCTWCTTNDYCSDAGQPRCEDNYCMQCLSDEDCAHIDGAPFCNLLAGRCGECNGPEQCQDPAKPQCNFVSAVCEP